MKLVYSGTRGCNLFIPYKETWKINKKKLGQQRSRYSPSVCSAVLFMSGIRDRYDICMDSVIHIDSFHFSCFLQQIISLHDPIQ